MMGSVEGSRLINYSLKSLYYRRGVSREGRGGEEGEGERDKGKGFGDALPGAAFYPHLPWDKTPSSKENKKEKGAIW